jgi:hypothetical protein
MELREDRDRLDKQAKDAKEAYQEAEMELFELLSDGPVSRLNNVDLGEPWGKVSFGARETIYGRVIPGKESEAREHFTSRGQMDVLTTPKFVAKRLNEIAREHYDGGEQFPPGIDWYARRGVTITRQKD